MNEDDGHVRRARARARDLEVGQLDSSRPALAVDREGQFVYSAGGDGSIFIHNLGHAQISRSEIPY